MRTLEITSYIGCPNQCSYCPQAELMNAYKGKMSMSLGEFGMILSNTPNDVRIDFSGFSEIFCHDEGAKFILLASSRGYKMALYTTLVGFTRQDADILSGVKFDDVCFHRYPDVDLRYFEQKIEWFQTKIQAGRTAEITPQWLWSRAGNLSPREKGYGPLHCLFADKLFDHNVVLPNGDVFICCQDYSLKHKIGNLYESAYDSLDRVTLRRDSNMIDSDLLCRFCELAQYEK
jgi:sulfatase maturation enzyme AslB (radical SAM superfamily)